MTEPTWLTPAAYRRLEEELEQLTTDGRTHIEERIAEARSHGDISENADYEAAKHEQGLMEARIRRIKHMLDTAEVREAEDAGHVTIGSVVTIKDADGDQLDCFVAPQENKVAGLMLASPSSPLGSALLGAGVGDTVAYQAPGGTFEVEIVAVRPYEG